MSAYEEGKIAYKAGYMLFNNPYSGASYEHNEWIRGWCYASYNEMMNS